jgi:hypothetical protein
VAELDGSVAAGCNQVIKISSWSWIMKMSVWNFESLMIVKLKLNCEKQIAKSRVKSSFDLRWLHF